MVGMDLDEVMKSANLTLNEWKLLEGQYVSVVDNHIFKFIKTNEEIPRDDGLMYGQVKIYKDRLCFSKILFNKKQDPFPKYYL